MRNTRLIVAASAAALALGMLSAPALAATTTPAKPAAKVVVKKVHYVYVSGKIVSIDAPLAMLTLSNGKTYRLLNTKNFSKFKVGQHVRLRIG